MEKEYIDTDNKLSEISRCPGYAETKGCGKEKRQIDPYCKECNRVFWKHYRKKEGVRERETEYMRNYRKQKKEKK
jgi:hypothetical protein